MKWGRGCPLKRPDKQEIDDRASSNEESQMRDRSDQSQQGSYTLANTGD